MPEPFSFIYLLSLKLVEHLVELVEKLYGVVGLPYLKVKQFQSFGIPKSWHSEVREVRSVQII